MNSSGTNSPEPDAPRAAWSGATLALIERALEEDLGERGDVTSALLDDPQRPAEALLRAREGAGVVCGLALAPAICGALGRRLGTPLEFTPRTNDGAAFEPGAAIAALGGLRAALLAAERTLLNFLARMTAVATHTRGFVDLARAENPSVEILDTRKTLPGWRELDRYAVRCGGGKNHRDGLFDAVLIKDNHLAGVPVAHLADELRAMIGRIGGRPVRFVEVEVDTLQQLDEALKVEPIDVILLDNFNEDDLRRAVQVRNQVRREPRPLLEASGGVSLSTVGRIAKTGVERISIGALTQSPPGVDLGLDFRV